MADVAKPFHPPQPTQERQEHEETETLDSPHYPYNTCDQDMYISDSDPCSLQSNPLFPEFPETRSLDLIIHEPVLDHLVLDADDDVVAYDDDEEEEDGMFSFFSFKPDQFTLVLDLLNQSPHIQEEQEDEDDDDGNDDYDGDGDIGSTIEETLSWDDNTDFIDEEFFVGNWHFDPVSESGESSVIPTVGSIGSINRCGCSPADNGCSCQNYDPGLLGFRSDLDEEEHFTTDDGSESNHEDNGFGFPMCLQEEFGWEDVRVDEREVLSQTRSVFEECMVVNGDEEMLVSSEINLEQESGNAVDSVEHETGLDWEVLLQVQDLDISPSDDVIEHDESYTGDFVYTAEYEVLFGQFAENDNLQKGSRPASKSFVDGLQSVFLSQEDYDRNNAVCAVCMDGISKAEQARRLPCLHHYHGYCILPWLGVRNTCPVCRFELPTDDPDYECWTAQRDGIPSERILG